MGHAFFLSKNRLGVPSKDKSPREMLQRPALRAGSQDREDGREGSRKPGSEQIQDILHVTPASTFGARSQRVAAELQGGGPISLHCRTRSGGQKTGIHSSHLESVPPLPLQTPTAVSTETSGGLTDYGFYSSSPVLPGTENPRRNLRWPAEQN